VSASSVLNGLCTYFGGAYDAVTRTYRTPQVAGLGVVRRAFAKDDVGADYYLGMATGTPTGCQLVVQLPGGAERRTAVPMVRGWKRVEHRVELHAFLISSQLYGEDAQDDFYALRDALFAKIHADPACGSGGFENLGFQVGEGELLEWDLAQAEAKAGQTRGYLFIKTIAVEYVQA
jgi:hypothetical protein